MAHYINFFGPPANGKSVISQEINRRLTDKGQKILLFWDTPSDGYFYSKNTDQILLFFLALITLINTSLTPRRFYQIGWRRWKKWLSRFLNEYKYCLYARRYILVVQKNYDYILDDSRIFSKFFYEMADPRNVCGRRLWPVVKFFALFLPHISIDQSYLLICTDKNVWRQRLQTKKHPVRADLSAKEREQFFEKSLAYSQNFFPYFTTRMAGKNILMIDTTISNLQEDINFISGKILSLENK